MPEAISNPETSQVFLFDDGSLIRAFLTKDDKWRFPTKIEDYPNFIIDGLICLEDKRFFFHPGIDPLAVSRAVVQNLRYGKTVSGASTLTMQLSRMLGKRQRTTFNKIIEMLFSVFLETKLSKEQILKQYLMRAPFGSNIEGIEAASFRYFDKPARFLTKSEAAFLYLLPQAPHRWDQKTEQDVVKLRARNLKRWYDCGIVTEDELRRVVDEKIPVARHSFKGHAHHFTDWAQRISSGSEPISTTLSAPIQRQVEKLLLERQPEFLRLGINNGGVLVTKVENNELVSAAGNFDFRDNQRGQKVNSFLAFRSPGSLLKPLLFARLIEIGQITPQSLIEDVPIEVEDYSPKNYDGDFSGLVQADRALADSLNVPWVRELKKMGLSEFLSFLEAGGLRGNIPIDKVGLSLIVGGMEMQMWNLVSAYTALAGNGEVRDIRWRVGEEPKTPHSWINPGAAFLTRESLALKGRPDFGLDPKRLSQKEIKWKTGTSQGRRDAWAIGFDEMYLVAVWLGNLDRSPSPALVGGTAAAPLMFDIFSRINRERPQIIAAKTSEPFGNLVDHEVCAFSGLAPVDGCKERRIIKGVKGVDLKLRCPYHKEVLVDPDSGYRVEQNCMSKRTKPLVKSFLVLPKDVNFWFETSLQMRDAIPAFHPACKSRPTENGKLSILSPQPKVYFLHEALGKNSLTLPIKIKTVTNSDVQRCFLNGTELKIKSVGFEDSEIRVTPGKHELFCVDQAGRGGSVTFAVSN